MKTTLFMLLLAAASAGCVCAPPRQEDVPFGGERDGLTMKMLGMEVRDEA